MGNSVIDARNRLGNVIRHHADDPDKITAARRDLAAAKIEKRIREVVAEAPPLTSAQCKHLAQLLGGGVR